MRYVAIVVLATGCASASSPANSGNGDADTSHPTDGKVFEDAATHPPDAPGHRDAPRDSPPDAFVYLDACVPRATQILVNAAFDQDATGTGWVQQPTPNLKPVCGPPPNGPFNMPCGPYYPITSAANGPTPQSPAYKVFEGGLTGADTTAGGSATDALYQDVAIPAGTTSLVLTGYYIVGSTESTTSTTMYDTFSMDLTQPSGTPIENVLKFSNLNAQTVTTWNAFTHTFVNPAAIAGTTVRLHLTSTNDISNNSNFFFDTLALTATHCP